MKVLSYQDLAQLGVKVSKASLWRWERAGVFPRRVSLSSARHGWIEAEVHQWLESRVRARDKPRPPAVRRRRRASLAAAAACATEPSTT
jgi:predicted DNA-binding transcriptional regulator AlpA